MSNLRLAKKTRTREALLAQAQRRIRARGSTAGFRIRDVAEAAGVSEASFYNYFGSREALLSEWAHRIVATAFAAGAAGPAEASAPGTGASGSALRRRLRAPLRELAQAVHAEQQSLQSVWRHATLLPDLQAPGAPVGLLRSAEGLVRAAQQAGELRADVPAAELGALLHTAAIVSIARWLGAPEAAPPVASAAAALTELETALRRCVDLVLDGARKRNERIRPGRGALRSSSPGPALR